MQLERIACVALAVLGLGLPPAHVDDYPTREVHVICAYAPGTGADSAVTSTRIVACGCCPKAAAARRAAKSHATQVPV